MRTWDVVLCAAGFARYCVRGVLEGDGTLARAAVGFFVLGVAAIPSLL